MGRRSEECVQEFLIQIDKLVCECERRKDDANIKVTKYIVKRLKSSMNAVELMKLALESGKIFSSTVTPDDLNELQTSLLSLYNIWLIKQDSLEKTPINPDYSRYKVKKVHTGLPR